MNFKESTPIFIQIANRICDEILLGIYTEGERVPSVREYSALIQVNVNTAMRSYDHLQSMDIIFNKRGIGYFVSEGAADVIKVLRRDEFISDTLPELFKQMEILNISIEELASIYQSKNK